MAGQLRLVTGRGVAPRNPSSVEFRAKAFYAAYPRHVGWGNVVKAYPVAERNALATLRTDGNPDATIDDAHQAIMDGLARAVFKPGFTPHPTTWLNGQRWLDEPEPVAVAPSPAPISDERTARIRYYVADWRKREAEGFCTCGLNTCTREHSHAASLIRKLCPEAWAIVGNKQDEQ